MVTARVITAIRLALSACSVQLRIVMSTKKRVAEPAQKQEKRRKKTKPSLPTLKGNELLEAYYELRKTWDKDMVHLLNPKYKSLDRKLKDGTTRREQLLGHDGNLEIAEKYAWAIPDERALRVIEEFGPVVEMGAGRGAVPPCFSALLLACAREPF